MLEYDQLEVPSSLNRLLDWLIIGARQGGLSFATSFGDIATLGQIMLRNRIAMLEQQSQTRQLILKARESLLLRRLLVANRPAQMVSTSAEAFLKRQSAMEQKVVSIRNQLSAAPQKPSVDAESRPVSVGIELEAANNMIEKLRFEVQTGRDQMTYNRRWANDQYSRAVDKRLKAESNHRLEVLVCMRCVADLESKLFAASDAETQTRERNTELGVRLAAEDTRRSWMIDA